jgi:hypothetical protein
MIQRRLWILAAATSLMCQEKPARLADAAVE